VSGTAAVVFLIDDNRAVRETIQSLLASVGLRVETFANAEDFLKRPPPDGPACLVLDMRLPGLSGLDLLRELQRTGRALPTIFITGHGDVPISVEAMKAGAVDFLLKPFREQELLDAIHQALGNAAVARRRQLELDDLHRRYASLTPREREVMARVVRGLLNKQIGAELETSEVTIKMHRAHVMRKMQVQSVAELTRIAVRLGL
jgi:FixJ family two-component response regulator